MPVAQNVKRILQQMKQAALDAHRKPEDIALLAVTKNLGWNLLQEAYEAGCRDLGESRVKEALEKIERFPADIRWHFIGKLQKNKIPKILGRFVLIHSVDTPELAIKISEASVHAGMMTQILLESNTSGEESKEGAPPHVWIEQMEHLLELRGISIQGMMTMAPLTEDEGMIRHCFSELRHTRDALQALANTRADLSTLSMGMSNDFLLAIQEGSTLVRIGTALFNPSGG